jgi:hypothetical protein
LVSSRPTPLWTLFCGALDDEPYPGSLAAL